MIVSLLVAMDERRGIGKQGRLPWRLSTDMKRFRQLTMGHHIVVGRKTFESIGKPLAGRQMIIVTRDRDYKAAGCFTVHSITDAIELAHARGEAELFICGGAEVYRETLDLAERIYLTQVHADCDADTFFPEFNRDDWLETASERHAADEKNEYPFTFVVLVKKRAG
ncbi:MAG: dihydrofolate reductase [Blastocatellia bacterium]